jgi:FtsP/CotA-like multicopper oxidase with cupredoxin domain
LSLTAEIPEMDPVPNLDHDDMGMGMHDMEQSMEHMGHDMGTLNPAQHRMPVGQMMSGMDHNQHAMAGMEHSQQSMAEAAAMAGMDHSQHRMPNGQMMPGMSHDAHRMAISDSVDRSRLKPNPSDFTAGPVTHARTEYGPHIDMRADAAQYRLDDPGVGLRDNGRKVLTYADLRNLRVSPDMREPDREIELHLTGNMGRYMWSINGVKHADAEPLRWKLGERLRITFVNDTMMNHPMHLHGMWSDLETGDNNFLPRKHTVIVQPGSRISYRVTVDAQGGWAYHCHLLYHMLGMFRTVIVS